jgi:hypothetical protein
MIKILVVLIGLMTSINASAFDIYGVSDTESKKIMKIYGKDIADFETTFNTVLAEMQAGKGQEEDSPTLKKVTQKRLALIDKLIKDNGYLFVDLDIITYPDEKNKAYLTLEIIDKQHPERLRFINTAEHTNQKRTHSPDVIEEMVTYESLVIDLMMTNKPTKFEPCPVYHCLLGFKNPKLAPYLKKFNNAAIKERALILDTLNHDPSFERRAAAAFLIGHFQDPHEIISLLEPAISDKNEKVRNNVMRVIAATMRKAKINDIDVTPFLNALDSPYTTDRNKALSVLFTAADNQATKPVLLKKGGETLVAILALQQPNNHDWAYETLKKISGKDFGATNVSAWHSWVLNRNLSTRSHRA